MEDCEVCGSPAEGNCTLCGKPLCKEHIKQGISLRTNAPAINCPSCDRKMPKKLRSISLIMIVLMILVTIIIVIIIGTTIPLA